MMVTVFSIVMLLDCTICKIPEISENIELILPAAEFVVVSIVGSISKRLWCQRYSY